MEKVISTAAGKMDKTVQAYRDEAATMRTGRASAALLAGVKVDYYGTPTPLMDIAAVAAPEPRLLVVKPYDQSAVQAINKAIQAANLGFNPAADGALIRISVPPLSEDRRKELVKMLKKKAEDGKIALRNIRRDAIAEIQKLKKDGTVPEDMAKKGEKRVQDTVDRNCGVIDDITAKKEKEIMEV
ncbi:MAG TPA: ribosome recycling factor [bacterium]|nr:ribosome recycling factor [bacterium]